MFSFTSVLKSSRPERSISHPKPNITRMGRRTWKKTDQTDTMEAAACQQKQKTRAVKLAFFETVGQRRLLAELNAASIDIRRKAERAGQVGRAALESFGDYRRIFRGIVRAFGNFLSVLAAAV